MINFIKSLYFHQRFFIAIFSLPLFFLFAHWWPLFFYLSWILLGLLLFGTCYDLFTLFSGKDISAQRQLPHKFSNSDENQVRIVLDNVSSKYLILEIVDEIPVQFQKRDFSRTIDLPARTSENLDYYLRPLERGEYHFGKLHIFCSTRLLLIKRRYSFDPVQMVKVYPSFLQMKKYDFLALQQKTQQMGIKRIRRIGHSMEFEQIRNYVPGDDIRGVNWKATAKHGSLMVNQYQEEQSQAIYSIIDCGRSMKMPFEGLKLLDYAINSSLAFSNIAIQKKDKAGLICFSNSLHTLIPAAGKPAQLGRLMESMYNLSTGFLDSDYQLLFSQLKKKVSQRSLLLLYTNFEHQSALERQLPYLRAINRQHFLVVIFFQNTELDRLIEKPAAGISDIFDQTVAEQFQYDKKLMVKALDNHGIASILTRPEDLSLNTINKYLEIKKRNLL